MSTDPLTTARLTTVAAILRYEADTLEREARRLGGAQEPVPLRVEDLPHGFREGATGEARYGRLVVMLTQHAGPLLCRAFVMDPDPDDPWVNIRLPSRHEDAAHASTDVVKWAGNFYPLDAWPQLVAAWIAQHTQEVPHG